MSSLTFWTKSISLFREWDYLLVAIENLFGVSGFHVDLSKKENPSNLNVFFLNTSIRGILEGIDFKFLGMVLLFVSRYFDRVPCYLYYSPWLKLHKLQNHHAKIKICYRTIHDDQRKRFLTNWLPKFYI